MTPAESMKDEGPPLTAADLDRLAHEWSERRVVTNSVEHREKADRARLERLKTALPSLLALARRGLEAEAEAGIHVVLARAACESAESKLAAALAEVERVRGRLAMAEAVTFKAAARVVSQMDTPPAAAQVALALAQYRALMVRTLGEQGDLAAAEAQSARPAAPKGGPG